MKTFNAIKTTVFLTAALILTSTGYAQDISQVRETGAFSALDAGSIFKIEFIQGENHYVEIITDEKNLDNVETRVRNGILSLNYSGSARNAKVTAIVMTPEIHKIKLSGAASLVGQTEIQSPSLDIDLSGATSATLQVATSTLKSQISGASNLTLSGTAGSHTSNASGASQLRAADLYTETTRVRVSGASNARVFASDFLDANASGTAKVSYASEPTSKQVSTSGMASINGTQAHLVTHSESGDTTRIRIGSRDVLVIEDDEREKVRVQRNRRRSFQSNWSGFEMGINGYMAPEYQLNLPADADLIDLRYERSFVYNLNLFQQNFNLIGNNLGFFTGVGLGFNNYRFDNQTRILQNREGIILVEDTINKIIRNKINLTYINVPLMLEFQTGGRRQSERFYMAGGVIVGARVGTNARYIYDDNGKKRKEKDYKDFHIAPFKFDLSGRIGWGRVNLFATYSINSLFKEGKGPELYPFTVGLRLVSF